MGANHSHWARARWGEAVWVAGVEPTKGTRHGMRQALGTVVAPLQVTKSQWSSRSHQVPAHVKDYHPLRRPNRPSPSPQERQAEPSKPRARPRAVPGYSVPSPFRGDCAATPEHVCRVTLQGCHAAGRCMGNCMTLPIRNRDCFMQQRVLVGSNNEMCVRRRSKRKKTSAVEFRLIPD